MTRRCWPPPCRPLRTSSAAPCPMSAPATWTPGYDSQPTRQTLSDLAFTGQIAHKGTPAPIQAGRRWPVERTHSWMNGYGKLRRMTDRNVKIVGFYLYLAAAFVAVRQLIQRARRRYRWDTRPATKRLK